MWDIQTGKELLTYRGAHHFSVHSVAFSSDGAHLLTMNTTAKFWDAVTDKLLRDYGLMGRVTGLVFSPDGERMADYTENTATIWDAPAVF